MLIGIILRHYKIYSNVNFIPINLKASNSFTMFIGNNGVGKSSILESLSAFFNNGYWNRSKNEKQDQTFICPVFLIKKEDFYKKLDLSADDKQVLQIISDYIFNLEATGSTKELNELIELKNGLNINKDEYFLLVCGITYKERNKTYFSSSLHLELEKHIKDFKPDYKIDNILNFVKKYYAYIYIPVESKMNDFLRLETVEMQKLMNEDILVTIEKVLKENKFKPRGKSKNISLVTYMNDALNVFMDEINEQIKKINGSYSFKVEDGYKKNLTASDLRDQILKAYFAIRTLKKDGKEIYELSSGEQRMALIDIATAFLNNNQDGSGQIILAIDEPEASLHISKCFSQFKRLEKLSLQNNTQVLLTTHWYGAIPTIQKGNLNHIEYDLKPNITTFDFCNYLEDRRNFPDDIDLKSFFELVSTIISSIKSDNTSWLIIEGSDDKNYFDLYLGDKINNLIILPVGGIGNVIKIYEYLFVPFSEKVEKGILKNSKVLCLIDSDINQKTTHLHSSQLDKSLKINRLQVSKGIASLQTLNNVGEYVYTSIEDSLDPQIMYSSLSKTIEDFNNEDIIEIFSEFEYNPAADSSRTNSDFSILKPMTLDAVNNKQRLLDFIKSNEFKAKLALNYKTIGKNTIHEMPEIFKVVKSFFAK